MSKIEFLLKKGVGTKNLRKYKCPTCLSEKSKSPLFTIDKLLNHHRASHFEHPAYRLVRNILKKIEIGEKLGVVV